MVMPPFANNITDTAGFKWAPETFTLKKTAAIKPNPTTTGAMVG